MFFPRAPTDGVSKTGDHELENTRVGIHAKAANSRLAYSDGNAVQSAHLYRPRVAWFTRAVVPWSGYVDLHPREQMLAQSSNDVGCLTCEVRRRSMC